MTHFTVGIIIPPTEDFITGHIETVMEPYDENCDVKPYVSYSIEKARAEIGNDIYRLEKIIQRRDPGYKLDKCQKLLDELRVTTPEERYREYIKLHTKFNAEGEPISTYNPESKWDWWVIGGRWDGWITNAKTAGERLADNTATTEQAIERNVIPHAIVTPDGEWHEHGKMGWWGILLTEKENWDSEAREILTRYPGHNVVILDAHI